MNDWDVPALMRLSPRIQRYDWGDPSIIPNLIGLRPNGLPLAEAWFGAHRMGPSNALTFGRWRPLDRLIESSPGPILGPRIRARFGGLPYLAKILSAVRPLSIQVHPNSEQAREGFALEEASGVLLDASNRRYKDANHKPEILVALTDFHALCGFRPAAEIAQALEELPALKKLLPPFAPGPNGLRDLLSAYFSIPANELNRPLSSLSLGSSVREAVYMPPATAPDYWAAFAHRELPRSAGPDPGLALIFLLSIVHLRPGQALFVPPGTPHAYLRGTGVEIMASSDNVLRAGLTSKHVDTAELLRVLRFDSDVPTIVQPIADEAGEDVYPVPVSEFALSRIDLARGARECRIAEGPETLIHLPIRPDAEVIVGAEDGELVLPRGGACLIADGMPYTLRTNSDARIFRVRVPQSSQERPLRSFRLLPEVRVPDAGAADSTRVYVEPVRDDNRNSSEAPEHDEDGARRDFVRGIRRNIEATEDLFAEGDPAQVIGTVSGSESARSFWQRLLEEARTDFGAREIVSSNEDLPVGQAFGLLLLWQRLRPRLAPGEGALFAFVFGEGTRATPLTEAECGQKPAIRSFVFGKGRRRRPLSIVELAMRYFGMVESYLRRSGFDGLVVKWGDEVQIPTLDLTGTSDLFRDADIVRFVSMRKVTHDEARNKDWVGVDGEGRVRAFIPRRPLEEMEPLADRGLLIRRDGELHGGINLGSIALSRALLDVLLEEFQADILDPLADRRLRPDLDPQLFTALCIATIADPIEREDAWTIAKNESPAIARLETNLPNAIGRLRRALDRFEEARGREIRMVAMDFGDQYWGDIGGHKQIGEYFMSLIRPGPEGEIARALAGLQGDPDENGNIIAGDTELGESVKVEGSVLIDAKIAKGEITRSVLIGTNCDEVVCNDAFDVGSTAPALHLSSGAGSYRVISPEPVEATEQERITTLVLPEQELLMRVSEDTDLREKAKNYDRPIAGNSLSFREAHEMASASDPALIETRREALAEAIRKSFSDESTTTTG